MSSDNSLKLADVFDIIKNNKPTHNSLDIIKVQDAICERLRIVKSDDIKRVVSKYVGYYKLFTKRARKFDLEEVVLTRSEFLETDEDYVEPQPSTSDNPASITPSAISRLNLISPDSSDKKHILELSDRHLRRRFSNVMSAIEDFSTAEDISPTKVHGFALKRRYNTNKHLSATGKKLFSGDYGDTLTSFINIESACAIFDAGKLTQRTYTDIRLILKQAGSDVLPPYDNIESFKKNHRPTKIQLQEPQKGVRYDYSEALKLTVTQILITIELPPFVHLQELTLNIHDGCDGSGSHSIFNQKGASETNNIIMYMFRVESICSNSDVIWRSQSHASASYCRPVMLLLGKEGKHNCQIMSQIKKERSNLLIPLEYQEKQLNIRVNARMTMIDGKLHTILSGLGGAFCCLCTFSEAQCNDIDLIRNGFSINRSLEQTLEICQNEFHLEKNRRKGDYGVRMGVTDVPITKENLNTLHPLHNLLRAFDWIYKICYHATAGHLSWSEGKLSSENRSSRALQFLKQAKESIQRNIKETAHIIIDRPDTSGHGGTSTTGNVAKALLNSNNRFLLTQEICNSELRSKIDNIIINLCHLGSD